MTSRRELLGLGLGAGTLAVIGGCAPLAARLRSRAPDKAFALPTGPTTAGVRVFGRAGFGHRPGDLQTYAKDGHERTIDRLLRADQPEDPALLAQLNRLDAFRTSSVELEDFHREEIIRQIQQASVLRAVYGANPLKERMVDFWSNHFNIYGPKNLDAFRAGADQTAVIREHALGSFPEMLRASAKSPAMLDYLDNERNTKGAPNENYAREIMELHTLGVDGGYNQHDIHEVARCFTGWTVENRFLHRKGMFRFDETLHDNGDKVVLGHPIPANGGQKDGERVLDILTSHPSTARFLAKKLAVYFLGYLSPDIEGAVADAYRQSSGDICAMLRPILLSQELLAGPPILKRPLDLMASALRATDATTDGGDALRTHLESMGQAAYQWPMPDGYPVKTTAWSGSMLPRWNFAFALAGNRIANTSIPTRALSVRTQAEEVLGRNLGPQDQKLMAAIDAHGLGMAIASPEYQWR